MKKILLILGLVTTLGFASQAQAGVHIGFGFCGPVYVGPPPPYPYYYYDNGPYYYGPDYYYAPGFYVHGNWHHGYWHHR